MVQLPPCILPPGDQVSNLLVLNHRHISQAIPCILYYVYHPIYISFKSTQTINYQETSVVRIAVS